MSEVQDEPDEAELADVTKDLPPKEDDTESVRGGVGPEQQDGGHHNW